MKSESDKTGNEATFVSSRRWLNRTVVGAGITSALGDFCYETTTVLLPGFLAVLGIPAAVLGLIEGIADAVASFTKMASGYVADKLGHRKLLVLVGYGLTPLGQAPIALAAGWPVRCWESPCWAGRRVCIGRVRQGRSGWCCGSPSFPVCWRCWLFLCW